MSVLHSSLRSQLEKTVVAARETAESAAKASLHRLAVDRDEPLALMTPEDKALRRNLRAKLRQLGDFGELVTECAYEHWHQMLFARFLADNQLLMHPGGVAVTLAECQDLSVAEGVADGWTLAATYASRLLPQIFRPDDPLLQVVLSPESQQALEQCLTDLPVAVFIADDSLGWVYQFWQTRRKEEVNRSEAKIDGRTIAPVTQLFTEAYMVQFLLQNTVGAWWVARHPSALPPVTMEYLRLLDDGSPAAGTFPGWPDTIRELRIMDPCCGSGHFLVAAFKLLVALRMAEEGLQEREAGDAVLKDNLFGLEIDQRCTQIAAFALALAAWKGGGYRQLPLLNIACSGTPVGSKLETWLALANGDDRLRMGMTQLYSLFQKAPDLGSLIDPQQRDEGALFTAEFHELQPLLEKVLQKEKVQQDDDLRISGVSAWGLARAAELLAGKYHLVITNVPYLQRSKQAKVLYEFCECYYPDAKADIATVFLERCLALCKMGGTSALVVQQYFLFLGTYRKYRIKLLHNSTWNALIRLGPGAFETISGEVVNVALVIMSNLKEAGTNSFQYIDVSGTKKINQKISYLKSEQLFTLNQSEQLKNPNARILKEAISERKLLGEFARPTEGLSTGDGDRYIQKFWEHPYLSGDWTYFQSAPMLQKPYNGLTDILFWQQGKGSLIESQCARIQGFYAWQKKGIIVARVGSLRASLYMGNLFDKNSIVITPFNDEITLALWAFVNSRQFIQRVRMLDKKTYVTTSVFSEIPFELEYWQQMAKEIGHLPELSSDDPTQWLFKGDPVNSTAPLQVAVSRILGYQWPEQRSDALENYICKDGVACLQALAGEPPVAERLRSLLAASYGADWSAAKLEELLAAVDYSGRSLDEWLRDGFFAQHCRLFHQRPFIWHIWDGRRDGFAALVNYHKLDKRLLERLTYTYLGDWIVRQQYSVAQGEGGSDARLLAAQQLQDKLKLILEGAHPYDIFVRWKPLAGQPIGWEPDLNDGVRLNIRPFMTANILRTKPNINWNKDRGKNPPGSPWGEERLNDRHCYVDDKMAARQEAGILS